MTLDLDPIRARLAAATPGPWEYRPFTEIDPDGAFDLAHVVADDPDDPAGDQVSVCASIMRPDADIIAAAPSDLAALLAEVERLRETVAHVRGVAESWRDGFGPGSHVEGVMGRQVVSVDHATSTILAALDGAE